MDNTLFNRYALALLSVAKEENKVEEYRLYLKEMGNIPLLNREDEVNVAKEIKKLISEDSFENISSKTVLVVGVGGVGGYVVEALVRSGIGKIIIVDGDMVDETNINRQIIALSSTVGQSKVDVFEKRIKDINEKCEVIKINKFIAIK